MSWSIHFFPRHRCRQRWTRRRTYRGGESGHSHRISALAINFGNRALWKAGKHTGLISSGGARRLCRTWLNGPETAIRLRFRLSAPLLSRPMLNGKSVGGRSISCRICSSKCNGVAKGRSRYMKCLIFGLFSGVTISFTPPLQWRRNVVALAAMRMTDSESGRPERATPVPKPSLNPRPAGQDTMGPGRDAPASGPPSQDRNRMRGQTPAGTIAR